MQKLYTFISKNPFQLVKGLIIFFCIIYLFQPGCTQRRPEGKIKIGYMQVSTGLPLFVALEKNIFEKYGLTTEPILFESVNQAMNALVTGQIDCIQGVGYTTFMAVEQNAPEEFKIFWTCADTKDKYTSAVLKRKGLSANYPADMRGKKIGTYTGTSQLINLKMVLKNLSIDPDKDVQIVQVGRQIELQAFADGQFDFLFTIEPDVTIALEKGIGETFIVNPRVKYILDPFVAGGAVVSTKFVREHPEATKKLVAVGNEAIEYIRGHESECKKYIPKYTPLTSGQSEQSGLYHFWKLGEEDRKAMQSLADLYLKEGELKKYINTSAMILSDEFKP
jgi:NitT/TauT family transport system substrate-binding protein